MEVPENEAFVLHEKRIKNFADMARNLNPLSHEDFMNHKNNVITWVEHSGKDYYLAEKLKKERSKERFVELLALRNKKEEAKHVEVPDNSHTHHELKKVEQKLKELDEDIPKPKKSESPIKALHFEFEFQDFIKLIDEAEHRVELKHYEEAIKLYEKLKDKFELSKLNIEDKKKLHKQIKELFQKIEGSINN